MRLELKIKKRAAGPYVCFFAKIHDHPREFYLYDSIFELYSDCFFASHTKFDLYGPTLYEQQYLIPLLKCLKENQAKLARPQSLENFTEMVLNNTLGRNVIRYFDREDEEWRNYWKDILKSLQTINQQLVNFVELCLKENALLEVDGP